MNKTPGLLVEATGAGIFLLLIFIITVARLGTSPEFSAGKLLKHRAWRAAFPRLPLLNLIYHLFFRAHFCTTASPLLNAAGKSCFPLANSWKKRLAWNSHAKEPKWFTFLLLQVWIYEGSSESTASYFIMLTLPHNIGTPSSTSH